MELSTPTSPAESATKPERASELELSVVIPCLNEAEGIGVVVEKAIRTMRDEGISGEVVVADNGSEDGSPEIARAAGARVVDEPRRGYGSAYQAGFAAARGEYILMGDADDTYDFTQIKRFVEPLREGADMVIGNRMSNIQPGAMPWLHQHIGNPLLTGLLNLFFRTGVRDAHCGMRAFRRDLLPALDLRSTGMEFASEHVIRAAKLGLDIRDIDIDYHPRIGESKLSSFSDGWRHLRFLLVHSPTWLFVIPGAAVGMLGILGVLVSVSGLELFGREWQLHAMIASVAAVVLGAQIVQIGVFSRAFAFYYLGEHDRLIDAARNRLRLEHGLLLGALLLLAGLVLSGIVLALWISRGLGELREERVALLGLMLLILGCQAIFGAFFLSVMGLRRRPHAGDRDAT
ncbi:MAG TPA: glycosyltransferase family 2 protein [Solirubrobacterales bacterium]|nr:glycosyltransferase family 2 protein [Solirubrobacterales bacterium]